MKKSIFIQWFILCFFTFTVVAEDFQLSLGSYLSTEPSQARGLAINSSAQVVIGYNNAAENAVIEFRLISNGTTQNSLELTGSMKHFTSAVNSGSWAAVGSFGLIVSNLIGNDTEWFLDSTALGGIPDRVSICNNQVVILLGNEIIVYDRNQTLLNRFVINNATNDVACGDDNDLIYVTGFLQVSANLQQPFLTAYNTSGTAVWENWAWSAAQAGSVNATADSRGQKVRFGGDGYLYFSGSTDGGNNVFKYNPKDLSDNANNISYDAYNQTFNISGSRKLGYFAKFNPLSGDLIQGQYLLTRLSSGGGNSVTIEDIVVDNQGQMLAGGRAFASINNRNDLTINGQAVGAYAGGDPYVLALNSAFSARTNWHTFGDNNAQGEVVSVDTKNGLHAFLIQVNQGSMITANALVEASDLSFKPNSDELALYLGIWGTVPIDLIFKNGFETL